MRKSWLLCVLLGTLAWGQAAPSAPAPAQPAPAAAQVRSASVPRNAAVITVVGVCPAPKRRPQGKPTGSQDRNRRKLRRPSRRRADCKTVITKAQFEKLAKALAPNA